MSRLVVYTVILGDYDKLMPPEAVSDNVDYYVYSDITQKHKPWKWVPYYAEDYNLRLWSRKHKLINPFEKSIYIDANIMIHGDIEEFYQRFKSKCSMFAHPDRDCIYDEAEYIDKYHFDDPLKVQYLIEKYRRGNFPKNYGLCANGIIIRNGNLECLRNTFEALQDRFSPHRDQLHVMYQQWITKEPIKQIPWDVFHEYFRFRRHVQRKKV